MLPQGRQILQYLGRLFQVGRGPTRQPGSHGSALPLQVPEPVLELLIGDRAPQMLLPEVGQCHIDPPYLQCIVRLGSFGSQQAQHHILPDVVQDDAPHDPPGELVFDIEDRVTTAGGAVTGVVVGIEVLSEGEFNFLRDWQLLQRLNLLSGGRGFRRANESPSPNAVDEVELTIDIGRNLVMERIPELDLRFEVPDVTLLAVLWPVDDNDDRPN
jgi:hypothetical protein